MKMYINGIAVDASDKQTIDVINPATGTVVDTIPAATKEDVDLAVEKAKAAQKIWAKVPVYEKVEINIQNYSQTNRDLFQYKQNQTYFRGIFIGQ